MKIIAKAIAVFMADGRRQLWINAAFISVFYDERRHRTTAVSAEREHTNTQVSFSAKAFQFSAAKNAAASALPAAFLRD